MHPSRRALFVAGCGLVLAALPALGLDMLWGSWVAFWAILVVACGLDAALLAGARELTCELELPPTLYVGDAQQARLRVRGPGRAMPAELKLDLSENLEPQPEQRGWLARAGFSFEVPIVPLRRGEAEVEAAWLRYTGPLGLIVRSRRLPFGRRAPIVPNLPRVRATALSFWSAREYAAGIKIERFVGDGSEFDSLREFQPGFDRRTVDWKASARHTKLLSRQFRAERSHQVVIAVDTGRLMSEPLEGIPRLDHAVHASLLLGYFGLRTGDRVGLYAFDAQPRLYQEPRAGMAAFRTLLARSGELAYTTAETNFTLGLTHLLAKVRRRSLVIVLTDFVDSVTAELMVDNVRRLAKRHLVIFVALRDPLLTEMTGASPEAMIDLHRAVVADSLVRERELVQRRLVRQGVFCIDAPPRRIGVDLVNRYLEVKRRELV